MNFLDSSTFSILVKLSSNIYLVEKSFISKSMQAILS